MIDLDKIGEIDDESELQKLLSSTENLEERKVIRNRLLSVKEIKSKERELAHKEREKRREEEIQERKNRKEEDRRREIERLDELAKISTSDRIHTGSSQVKEDYIKEKAKTADVEKKKILEGFEQQTASKEKKTDASSPSSSTSSAGLVDSCSDKENKVSQDCRDKDKIKNVSSSTPNKTESNKTSNSNGNAAASINKPSSSLGLTSANKAASNKASAVKNSTASAFKMFQSKDKEAGGNGRASFTPSTTPSTSSVNSPSTIKDNLLKWCQLKTQGYPNVNISNFSSSWANGMAFCALIHQFVPETFDFNRLNPKNRKGNFELAFKVAEDKCDIAPLLEVEDMLLMGDKPDYKCVFTYVQSIYRKFELEPRAKAASEAKNNES